MERAETSMHGMFRLHQVFKYCWSNKVHAEEVGKGPGNIKSYI